jgi:hypothetical protein
MKPLPSDPLALRARVLGALCDDLFDLGAGRSRSFGRTDAMRAVVKENPICQNSLGGREAHGAGTAAKP